MAQCDILVFSSELSGNEIIQENKNPGVAW